MVIKVKDVRDLIIHHEGMELKPYKCTAGKLTIGAGRNLEDNGITHEEALYLLDNDIKRCRLELQHHLSWFNGLNQARQAALIDMAYNLGISRLLGFHNMLTAMKHSEWERAANEALDSRWAKQVGNRAVEIADMIRKGE